MADGFSLTLDPTSIANLERALLAKLQQGVIEGGLSLKQQGEEIMEESRLQAPEDTGTLVSAAFVRAQGTGMGESVRIGYDGSRINTKAGKPVSAYLMLVHERLDIKHRKGNAKFFEGPVIQYMPKFEPALALALRRALLR